MEWGESTKRHDSNPPGSFRKKRGMRRTDVMYPLNRATVCHHGDDVSRNSSFANNC